MAFYTCKLVLRIMIIPDLGSCCVDISGLAEYFEAEVVQFSGHEL